MEGAPPSFVVLVGDLGPSDELASLLDLLTWLRTSRPAVRALVLARSGGAWEGRIAEVARVARLDADPRSRVARRLQQAHLAPLARALRASAARRFLRVGSVPVVVEASGEPSRAWLGPEAGPVLTHHHGTDEGALPDLWPQGARRDDEPDATARHRRSMPTAAHWLAVAAPTDEALPDDAVLTATWGVVEQVPGVRVVWVSPPLAAGARAALDAHLHDAGLAGLVDVVDDPDDGWRWLAAADAVLAAGRAPALALVADRTVPIDHGEGAGAAAATAALVTLLQTERPDVPPDPQQLASVAGPRWLELLGLA